MLKLKSDDFVGDKNQIKVVKRTPQPDFPEHNHDFSELVLVSSGFGSHVINGTITNLLPFTVSCVSDKDYHLYYGTENVNLTNIIYKKEQLSVASPIADIIKRFESKTNELMLLEHEFVQLRSLSEQIKSEQQNSDAHSNYMVSILFDKIWITLDRIQRSRNMEDKTTSPIVYICNHYSDPTLTINQICDNFSISPKSLTKAISDMSGLSPAKFINSLRMREAKLLLSKDISITEVAMSVGFNDSNYFSTKFKSTFGYTPREFKSLS